MDRHQLWCPKITNTLLKYKFSNKIKGFEESYDFFSVIATGQSYAGMVNYNSYFLIFRMFHHNYWSPVRPGSDVGTQLVSPYSSGAEREFFSPLVKLFLSKVEGDVTGQAAVSPGEVQYRVRTCNYLLYV